MYYFSTNKILVWICISDSKNPQVSNLSKSSLSFWIFVRRIRFAFFLILNFEFSFFLKFRFSFFLVSFSDLVLDWRVSTSKIKTQKVLIRFSFTQYSLLPASPRVNRTHTRAHTRVDNHMVLVKRARVWRREDRSKRVRKKVHASRGEPRRGYTVGTGLPPLEAYKQVVCIV